MLSENVLTIARRLEMAARMGAPLAPDDCEQLAAILTVAAADAAQLEGLPLAIGDGPVRPARDAARQPIAALCVTPPPEGSAEIIPFPVRPLERR